MPDSLAALDEPLKRCERPIPMTFRRRLRSRFRRWLSDSDSRRIEPALERLNELVERSPLEPMAPGVRANARQRTEAARQLPLWLVARACEKQSSAAVRELGERLGARALEAARRQSEPRWRWP